MIFPISKGPLENKVKNDTAQKQNLDIRMEELAHLISKNNQQFSRGIPSQEQLKNILLHNYNCYDQLDFISLEYTKNDNAFWSHHFLSQNVHRLMKATKILCSNIKNWLDNYSMDLIKRASEAHSDSQISRPFDNICKICKNNTEEILLREAKKQIIGPYHWKELFEEELAVQEEEEIQCMAQQIENRQYASSVNYLSKVIKEMESSIQGYEKMANKIQKDDEIENHPALKLLEEVLSKVRVKLGEKYKVREQEIVSKIIKHSLSVCGETQRNEKNAISQQYDIIVGQPPKKQRIKKATVQISPQQIIEHLKQENKMLLCQRNSISELYSSTQNIINQLTGLKNKKHSNFSPHNQKNPTILRDSLSLNQQNNRDTIQSNEVQEKVVYRERHHQTAMVAPTNQISTKKSMKESLIKRMTLFNMQRIESRREELSEFFGKDTKIQDISAFDWEKYFHKMEGRHKITLQPPKLEMVDAECQWQDDQRQDKHRNTTKSSKSINHEVYQIKESQLSEDQSQPFSSKKNLRKKSGRSSSRSINSRSATRKDNKTKSIINKPKKIKPTIMKDKSKVETSFDTLRKIKRGQRGQWGSKGQRGEKLENGQKRMIGERQNKSLSRKDGSKMMNHTSKQGRVTFNKKVQRFQKMEDLNKGNISLGRIQDKHHRSQTNLVAKEFKQEKERHTLGAFVKNIRIEVEEEESRKPVILQKIEAYRHFSTKGSRKDLGKHRLATEGSNDRNHLKKSKIVSNFLFKPEHLILFGGVSESFSYQNDKSQIKSSQLQEGDKCLFEKMVTYLESLQGFKRSIYENVVYFLLKPFELIEKSQFEFKQVSESKLKKIVLKLFLFHKKKCLSVECEHISMFSDLIGFRPE